MRSITTLALATAAVLLAGCGERTVYFTSNPDNAPFSKFESDEWTGFEVALSEKICESASWRCEWVGPKSEEVSFRLGADSTHPEGYLLTNSYFRAPSAFLANADRVIDATDPDWSAGLVVGVERGSPQEVFIMNHTELTARRYGAVSDIITDMRNEWIDIAFLDAAIAGPMLYSASDVQIVGDLISEPIEVFGEGLRASAPGTATEQVEAFNKELALLRAGGTYDTLFQEYFSGSLY